MLNFDEELKKFEKMDVLKDHNMQESPNEKVIDFQMLLSRFEKLTKVYYQVAQDLAVLKDDLQSRAREVTEKNQEIDLLRRSNMEIAKQLENTLLCITDFGGVLDRAQAMAQESKDSAVVNLLAQLNREINAYFKKIGIVEIDSLDAKFDPAIHDPISSVEKEGVSKYTLLQVAERGFVYSGKVLKKAKVVCAK